jgi:hypothetical protein
MFRLVLAAALAASFGCSTIRATSVAGYRLVDEDCAGEPPPAVHRVRLVRGGEEDCPPEFGVCIKRVALAVLLSDQAAVREYGERVHRGCGLDPTALPVERVRIVMHPDIDPPLGVATAGGPPPATPAPETKASQPHEPPIVARAEPRQ